MELKNFNKNKSGKIYYYNKFKKMRFKKFEIYLGADNPIQYNINDGDNYIYNHKVQIKDYEKFGLISSLKIDFEKIIIDTEWENFEHLISGMNSSENLLDELKRISRNYLEDTLNKNKNGDFELVDFSISYLIDGEMYEVSDYDEKRSNLFVKILFFSTSFFLISGVILFFYNAIIGSIVFCLPVIFFYLNQLYKGLKKLRFELKYSRGNKNIFYYYLLKLPFKIVFYSFIIVLILGWFLVPGYFIYQTSFYYSLLEILGGYVGEAFWLILYLFVMIYLGDKILICFDYLEKK